MKALCIFQVFVLFQVIMCQNTPSATNQTVTPQKLRFVIPARELNEFVKIKSLNNGVTNFSGFSIEVFRALADIAIPSIQYEFVPFTKPDGTMNGSFDDMLQAVQNKEYDGAIGDVSILFYRMQWVDFTMPYLDSETGLLVRVPTNNVKNVKLTPTAKSILALDIIVGVGIFLGVAIFVFSSSKPNTKTFVSVLVPMAILLTIASYMPPTPSSLLPTQVISDIKNMDDLKRTEAKVGYRQGAFVKNVLLSKGGLSESQLVELDSEIEMFDKLQKGGENDGVDALVAGKQSLQIFQSKHCQDFTLVPTFSIPSIGYAFAFPKDQSPSFVDRFSEAIVRLTDNDDISRIQARTLGDLDNVCQGKSRIIGSTLQDRLALWLPVANAIFVVVLIFCMLLSYSYRRH